MNSDLSKACEEGNIEQVNDLLKAGADSKQTNEYATPVLNFAVYQGHSEIVELLLKAGADPKQADVNGLLPIHLPIHNGHLKIVKLLKTYENKISSLSLLCLRIIYQKQINTDNTPGMILEWNFHG